MVRTRTIAAGLLMTGLSGLMACSPQNEAPVGAASDPPVRETLRRRAGGTFSRGWLSQPAPSSSRTAGFTRAPQLIQATVGAAPFASPARIGAVYRDAEGRLCVDVARPTVYAARSAVGLGGRDHEQWSYVWWKAMSRADPRVAGRQGVRMTLDASGSPVVWEVLGDTTGACLLFADRALEGAAAAEFGPPSPGRDFSLARAPGETPDVSDVLIVGLIEPETTPGGPRVYIGENAGDVHALLGATMPPQVAEIVGTEEYDLRPMADVEVLGGDTSFDTPPGGLESLLRLPTLPRVDPEDPGQP